MFTFFFRCGVLGGEVGWFVHLVSLKKHEEKKNPLYFHIDNKTRQTENILLKIIYICKYFTSKQMFL